MTLVVGALYTITFVVIALIRARFPFEIEWMEGGMLTHAARLLDGQRIYAAPSADFVPFFYTPGYPALLAALSPVTGGLSFSLARGVSIASTLVAFGLVFRIGQREAGWRYGALAVGLYAALFRTNGAFYDLARPDALFMAVLCGAVYVAYYRRVWWGALLAAALFALGFFIKQTVSVFVPATALYLFWRNWRHGLLFVVSAVGLGALGVHLLDRAHDGWFWTYIFEGHQGHLFYWKNILMEYWRDLLFLAPLLLLLPLLWFGYKVPVATLSLLLAAHWTYAFIFRARTLNYVPHMYYRELFYEEPRWQILVPPLLIALLLVAYRAINGARMRPRTDWFWLLMFVAGAGASGLNHSTQWAYSNCFMLISMFAAILIALAVRDLVEPMGEWRPRWPALVPLAVLVQLGAWYYDPLAQVPRERDYAALADLDRRLAVVEGPVFFAAHPFHAWQRDGRTHVHQMGIADVAFMGGVKDLYPRLRKKEWAAVVVDEQNRVPGLESSYYVGDQMRYPDKDALRSKTGFLVRPATIWYAQDPTERALAPGLTGNFEGGAFAGWSREGEAFGGAPASRRIPGMQGNRYADSGAGGPQATGRLRSTAFTVERPRLTFLTGGRAGRKAYLRVLVDGQEVARRPGLGQPRAHLRRVELDLSPHVGQSAVIEVVDEDAGGEIVVDDLRLAP